LHYYEILFVTLDVELHRFIVPIDEAMHFCVY